MLIGIRDSYFFHECHSVVAVWIKRLGRFQREHLYSVVLAVLRIVLLAVLLAVRLVQTEARKDKLVPKRIH